MKRLFNFYLFCMILCGSALAEVRIWKDRASNEYEAEFVRELFDKITLRDVDGKEHQVGVEELSDHDQKYIRVMVPPVMEIEFHRNFHIKPKPVELSDDDNDTVTILWGDVRITKISNRPFTSGLHAELFLIAKEVAGENYVLIDRTESDFLLEEDKAHQFKTKGGEIRIYTEYTRERRGEEYLGYLVAISDARGNIVQIKTNMDWLTDKVENLRELYTRGAASMYSRHFDKETVQKTEVPRPRYYPSRIR